MVDGGWVFWVSCGISKLLHCRLCEGWKGSEAGWGELKLEMREVAKALGGCDKATWSNSIRLVCSSN